jgi:hypothetical protein
MKTFFKMCVDEISGQHNYLFSSKEKWKEWLDKRTKDATSIRTETKRDWVEYKVYYEDSYKNWYGYITEEKFDDLT